MAQATVTSMEQLKANALAKPGDDASAVGLVDGASFNLIQRVAQAISKANLIPKAYQDNVPNCIVALNMAARMKADPMMVMQNLYVVHGNPSWSSQFLIATLNTCGRFTSLRYEFVGKPNTDEWGCKAWAIEKDTGERLEGALVTIGLAKKEGWYGKNGSKWQTMPEQMLRYRAASWFVRAYAPEIAMGLQTAEEIHDTYDMERVGNGSYTMTAAEVQEEAQQAVVTAEPDAPSPEQAESAAAPSTEEPDQPAEPIEPESKEIECPLYGTTVRTNGCPTCKKYDECPHWKS